MNYHNHATHFSYAVIKLARKSPLILFLFSNTEINGLVGTSGLQKNKFKF